jgi:methionyl aminopeptidase
MKRSTVLMMARGFGVKAPFQYSGALRPGVQSPMSQVPSGIRRPDYADDGQPKASKGNRSPWEVVPQSDETIAKMRVAGRIAREVLDEAVRLVKPGITTDSIDQVVHSETVKRNSYPSPLNYSNFPKSCCTSINEVICHGIPDSTVLKNGDIINIDVTIYHDGVHGDCSETVYVGEVSDKARDLVKTTYDAWQAAIAICKPGRAAPANNELPTLF